MYSNLQLLDAISKPEKMVKKAIELGYKGIAISDHEVLSSHVNYLEIRDSLKDTNPDFKIILANEIYLIDKSDYQTNNKKYHFLLIAKDEIGYRQMRELSSRAWGRAYPFIKRQCPPTFYEDFAEVIGENKGHLIASTACMGGYLGYCILKNDSQGVSNFVQWSIDTFGQDNFFLEMQVADSMEQKLCNEKILKISSHFNIPYIITSDSHYVSQEDIGVHHAFLNSREDKERETESFYKYCYLIPIEEQFKILSRIGMTKEQIELGLNNTKIVADMVTDFDFRHKTLVPNCKISQFQLQHILKEWYEKYTALKNFAYSEYEQDRYLLYLIEQGIIAKDFSVDDSVAERIHTELDVIWHLSDKMGERVGAYLNLVKTIIDIIWKVSIVSVGRGSAPSYLINYLIDITQFNPIPYKIPYWRFLNKEKVELPDIDIDVNPEEENKILSLLCDYFGENNVLKTITFSTATSKSAIQIAGRGLGLNDDDVNQVTGLIPAFRGKLHSIKECLEGIPEDEVAPVAQFQGYMDKYPGLLETSQDIEGLISGAGVHASSLYIFDNGYITHNSLMRGRKKQKITAYDMYDSDKLGALKFDLLKTDAMTKITKCMQLLLKDGIIQWQGSLKATYDKYLHPDALNYSDIDMWTKAADGKILNLFQFETHVGGTAIKKIRPNTIEQMAATNAVMRLVGEKGKESPIDRYFRFKNNPKEWYIEMSSFGLYQREVTVLEKHLSEKYGCSIEQEDFMRILIDPEITGFTLKEANYARKILAKKLLEKINELKEFFYKKGEEQKSRRIFLDYVWKKCLEPLVNYSFSLPHDLAYSLIGLQEMNLATQYNPLYWQCACLSVNSGASDADFEDYYDKEDLEEDEYDKEDEGEEEVEFGEAKRIVSTDYGKMAVAIGQIQQLGVKISLPDVNKSSYDFIPDTANNTIYYGLQAVTKMNPEVINAIIKNRPYGSLIDFCERSGITNLQIIALIKGGAFDLLEKKKRTIILDNYFTYRAKTKIKKKEKLTMTSFKTICALKAHPEEFERSRKIYNFKSWIDDSCVDVDNKKYYKLSHEDEIKFFKEVFMSEMKMNEDYTIIPEGYWVRTLALKKLYEQKMNSVSDWLKTDEAAETLYKAELESELN